MLFLIFLFLLANHIIINTETVAADNLKPEETYTHIRPSYKNIYIYVFQKFSIFQPTRFLTLYFMSVLKELFSKTLKTRQTQSKEGYFNN